MLSFPMPEHIAEEIPGVQEALNDLKTIRRDGFSAYDNPYYTDWCHALQVRWDYVHTYLPELVKGGKTVVDVGVGPGFFMHICGLLNNQCFGDEADLNYINTLKYKKVINLLKLSVTFRNFNDYLFSEVPYPLTDNSVDIFNFQASLDGILFGSYSKKPSAVDALDRTLALVHRVLKPKGLLMIWHNETGIDLITEHMHQTRLFEFVIDRRKLTKMRKLR